MNTEPEFKNITTDTEYFLGTLRQLSWAGCYDDIVELADELLWLVDSFEATPKDFKELNEFLGWFEDPWLLNCSDEEAARYKAKLAVVEIVST